MDSCLTSLGFADPVTLATAGYASAKYGDFRKSIGYFRQIAPMDPAWQKVYGSLKTVLHRAYSKKLPDVCTQAFDMIPPPVRRVEDYSAVIRLLTNKKRSTEAKRYAEMLLRSGLPADRQGASGGIALLVECPQVFDSLCQKGLHSLQLARRGSGMSTKVL